VLKRLNLGTIVYSDLQFQVFKRAYICLAACKDGFAVGCQPILCFDGCWLKDKYESQLLNVVAINVNDYIFPVAYSF
jgi:hypothetical protein